MYVITNKIRQLNKKVALALVSALLVLVASLSPLTALAASSNCVDTSSDNAQACCGGANSTPQTCDLISLYINPVIVVLSGIFGLIAVASIIMGGIQYSASEGDPQKVTQAKNRIAKTIFAIMAYFFLFAFLEFIVPGGAFKGSG